MDHNGHKGPRRAQRAYRAPQTVIIRRRLPPPNQQYKATNPVKVVVLSKLHLTSQKNTWKFIKPAFCIQVYDGNK